MRADVPAVDLAPAVVVRAARFALAPLLGLADSVFVRTVDGAAMDGDRAPKALEDAYGASIEVQRRLLSALTIEDVAFRRALAITNEELSRRLTEKQGLPVQRNKRTRHLETTLYRYLARACWRTAPCDLWAGLTLAEWGDAAETRVEPRPVRHAFAPDLRPFQSMVRALSLSGDYHGTGRYRLNPTLRLADGAWHYSVRSFSVGAGGDLFVKRQHPSRPGLDLLLRSLEEMPPSTFEEIVADLERRGGVDTANLHDVLSLLVRAGMLVGGLAFPTRFSSPWVALVAVARDLRPEHARIWRAAVLRLRRLCRRAERDIGAIPVEELHAVLERLRAETDALAAALGVTIPELPRSILRADVRLPFAITFGEDARRALEQAVVEYDAFDRRLGVDAAVRVAHRARVLSATGDAAAATHGAGIGVGSLGVPTQEWAWQSGGEDPALGTRLRRLSRWIDEEADERVVDVSVPAVEIAPPPIGGLIVRPTRQGYYVAGCTTEIAAMYGRYGSLWYGLASRERDRFSSHGLHQWYVATLTRVAHDAGVALVEYDGPCEPSPNGLARPEFDLPRLNLWGTEPALTLKEARVLGGSAPLLFAKDRPLPISVQCFTPLNVAFQDLPLERILLTSFREIPTWIWPGLPMEREITSGRPAPRLALASGNVVRTRRTILVGDELSALVKAKRVERFVRWRALARKYRWPALVLVGRDARVPLLVVRDSPLAVEAGLEGIGDGVTFISIEEPDEHHDGWLVDEKGDAYVTELVVPFVRRSHAWSGLGASQRRAS